MPTDPPTGMSLLLLLRVHALQAWRRVKTAADQSRFLSWIICLFLGGYAVIAVGLFGLGLRRLSAAQGIGSTLIEEMVFLLFAFLFTMLLFSNVVMSYSNFFRNREASWLSTLPLPASTLFQWKFIESAIVASWAFLLLMAPLLVAYGLHYRVPWHFYPLTTGLVALFIVLPAVLGCWSAILMARYMDRRMVWAFGVPLMLLLIVGLYQYLSPAEVMDEALSVRAGSERSRLLSKARFAQFPFMPSYWLSKSVVEWKDGVHSLAGFYFLVLLSNSLFFGFVSMTATGRLFVRTLADVHGRGTRLLSAGPLLLRYAGLACAVVALGSLWLPHADITPALRAARHDMAALRARVQDNIEHRGWLPVKLNTPEAGEVARGMREVVDGLGRRLGAHHMGPFAMPDGEAARLAPGFVGLMAEVEKYRGFVGMETLEAEFQLRLVEQFHPQLTGWDLLLNRSWVRDAPRSAGSIAARLLLALIALSALVAIVTGRRVGYAVAGALPMVALAWFGATVTDASLRSLGVGAWMALAAGWGQLLEAMGIWQRLGAMRHQSPTRGPMERLVAAVPFLGMPTRALLVKDIRIFWRDTSQWMQTLVMFGILGVYMMNLRQFTQQFNSDYWRYVVAYMNLAACALNLATFTTRFVYPQFSLEGKRLWIVGMAPLGLARVVLVKLGLAAAVSTLISLPLITLSGRMLGLPGAEIAYFAGGLMIMVLTLNSLAISMGVLYPNLREDNPSKIVSGLGGTFCLVISFIYIGVSIICMGLGSPWKSPWHLLGPPSFQVQLMARTSFILFSLGLGLLPLIYARNRLTEIEH